MSIVSGLEIERIPGKGPTLVFLHEGLGCVARWRDFPRRVASATGHPALVYSRRGYGQSEPAPLPRPLTFMHEEALSVLPALLRDEGIEDAILIGHSDGASIALIYAGAIGKGIRGVLAIAPHVFVEPICVRAIQVLSAQYDDPKTLVRERLAKAHKDVDNTFRGWAAAWLDPKFLEWNLTDYLPSIEVPVMALQGEDDDYGTLAQIDTVCARVRGPSERVVVPSCGHVPMRDQPEATLAATLRFIRSLAPDAA